MAENDMTIGEALQKWHEGYLAFAKMYGRMPVVVPVEMQEEIEFLVSQGNVLEAQKIILNFLKDEFRDA